MTEFFGVEFTRSKSQYGSVEPRNGICVAELILCDLYYMALLTHFPLLYLHGPAQCAMGIENRT
jgi:hypothetical protein